MKKYKVFVGACDTYHPEDYSFIGTWEECIEYIKNGDRKSKATSIQ